MENKKRLWQENIGSIISNAIFFENEGNESWKLNPADESYLKNKTFRQFFIDEVIHVKKNLSGLR